MPARSAKAAPVTTKAIPAPRRRPSTGAVNSTPGSDKFTTTPASITTAPSAPSGAARPTPPLESDDTGADTAIGVAQAGTVDSTVTAAEKDAIRRTGLSNRRTRRHAPITARNRAPTDDRNLGQFLLRNDGLVARGIRERPIVERSPLPCTPQPSRPPNS